jgi:hypothetical protein
MPLAFVLLLAVPAAAAETSETGDTADTADSHTGAWEETAVAVKTYEQQVGGCGGGGDAALLVAPGILLAVAAIGGGRSRVGGFAAVAGCAPERDHGARALRGR